MDISEDNDLMLHQALETGICLGLPGISIAIGKTSSSSSSSSLLWSGSKGFSELETKQAMSSTEHSFCIGSITKTFVAVVILQLVEEGKLDLNKTVLDYLRRPTAAEAATSSTSASTDDWLCYELVSKVPNSQRATLRHLLCHQSGIPTWEFQPDWIRAGRGADIVDEDKIWTKLETLTFLVPPPNDGDINQNDNDDDYSATTATFFPGQCFSYSNTNYTLLGLVIEHVTGNEASMEIRNRILEPLELTSAYLDSFEKLPANSNSRLPSHYHFATSAFRKSAGVSPLFSSLPHHHPCLINTSRANFSTEWTAGGLVMTMPDLWTYAQALLQRRGDGSSRLLSKAMLDEMKTYRPPASDIVGEDSAGTKGKRLNDSGDYYCSGICKHLEQQQISWGHGGLTLGFSSNMVYLEDSDVIVTCATNVGSMHSGFPEGRSPWNLFVSQVLMPAVKEYIS